MYGLYTLLALLFFFGAWYILRLRHQVALLSHRISFHVGLSARLGILIVTYDAKSDEAVLSEDLARLLDLPEKIGGLRRSRRPFSPTKITSIIPSGAP